MLTRLVIEKINFWTPPTNQTFRKQSQLFFEFNTNHLALVTHNQTWADTSAHRIGAEQDDRCNLRNSHKLSNRFQHAVSMFIRSIYHETLLWTDTHLDTQWSLHDLQNWWSDFSRFRLIERGSSWQGSWVPRRALHYDYACKCYCAIFRWISSDKLHFCLARACAIQSNAGFRNQRLERQAQRAQTVKWAPRLLGDANVEWLTKRSKERICAETRCAAAWLNSTASSASLAGRSESTPPACEDAPFFCKQAALSKRKSSLNTAAKQKNVKKQSTTTLKPQQEIEKVARMNHAQRGCETVSRLSQVLVSGACRAAVWKCDAWAETLERLSPPHARRYFLSDSHCNCKTTNQRERETRQRQAPQC